MNEQEINHFIDFVRRHEKDKWVMLTPKFALRLAYELRRLDLHDIEDKSPPTQSLETVPHNQDILKS